MAVTRTYVGPHDEVEVPSLGLVVKHGASVEVSAAVAAQLDEQPGNWSDKTPTPTPSKTSKED